MRLTTYNLLKALYNVENIRPDIGKQKPVNLRLCGPERGSGS